MVDYNLNGLDALALDALALDALTLEPPIFACL